MLAPLACLRRQSVPAAAHWDIASLRTDPLAALRSGVVGTRRGDPVCAALPAAVEVHAACTGGLVGRAECRPVFCADPRCPAPMGDQSSGPLWADEPRRRARETVRRSDEGQPIPCRPGGQHRPEHVRVRRQPIPPTARRDRITRPVARFARAPLAPAGLIFLEARLGRRGPRLATYRDRRQPWRARPTAYRVSNAHVGELHARPCAPEQQTATAHVPATHEVEGEFQPLAQRGQQRIDVLAGRDAAEQDHLAVRSDSGGQLAGVAVERLAVAWVVALDVDAREAPQTLEVHRLVGGPQAFGGRDDVDAHASVQRARERARVRQLSTEIQPAQKREHLAERSARADTDSPGEVEGGPLIEDESRALTPAVRRRKQEDPTQARPAGATALANSAAVRVLSTSSRRTQPRRAMATPYRTLPSSATEWASVDTTKRTPRSRADLSQRGARSSRRGSPLISTAARLAATVSRTSSTRQSTGGRERTRRPRAWPQILKHGSAMARTRRRVISSVFMRWRRWMLAMITSSRSRMASG